jgi:signal transduction histidine kinase
LPRVPRHTRFLRRAAGRGAAALPTLLLAGIVALVGVLAYQAVDAARSDVARAEATLRDYSAFAGAEYARQAEVNAQTVLRLSFDPVVRWLNFSKTPQPDPTPEQVAAWVRQRRSLVDEYVCDCLDSMRYAFRVDVADSTIAAAPMVAGGPRPSAEVQAWVRDTVLGHMARLERPGPMTVQTYGATDPSSREFDFIISNDSYVALLGEHGGRTRLLAYLVARDLEGNPVAAYGYESVPETWLRPLLQRAMDSTSLLPPSLLRGLRNDQVLAVSLSDGHGHELYRSSERRDARFASEDTLGARFGDVRLRLAVFPEHADRLLVGGLPRSRLPLLAALSLLTIGLAVVALLQLRKQQQLARLRTDFVSGVSHELRTPLAQIRWFAELLRMGRLRTADERDRSLRIIDQEARRLAFLVENVLNFSRSSRDAGRVTPEPVALAHEVREVVDSFRPLADARRMQVELRAAEVAALADRAALRQILLNLLDNAAKCGPPGQTIRVTVARGGIGACVAVADEGPGVPEAERERVWQPFYRADRDVTSATTGSGIGLSVVNELVRQLDGRRRIEPVPGGTGARVVIELPLAPARHAEPEPELHSDEYPVASR